jgi:glycerophosphoryl diester phosphodiesterase
LYQCRERTSTAAVDVHHTLTALISLIVPAAMAGPAPAKSHPKKAEPLVIAHRGASGYRPEHTLAAYALGARMGADYIEPDLVSTKDGVLVARHENEISATTDVADHPEFASRRTTKTIDGVALTGWFTEDFTLRELKMLRAKERIPELRPRNTLYNGRYEIPTFQEVLDLAERLDVGVYPETKHPTYFRAIGLPLEKLLVRALKRFDGPAFIQSFEVGNLEALDRETNRPLVQLLAAKTARPVGFDRTYGEMATPAGLKEIAKYADGVGPSKDYVEGTSFVNDAHRSGLVVHPYTFRNENAFLPPDLRSSDDPAAYGNAFAEYERFAALGVDGFFTDNADTAVEALSLPPR